MNSPHKDRKKLVRIPPAQFAKAYFENNGNGLQAIKQLDSEISDAVAGVKATRMLKDERVQALLQNIEDSFKLSAVKGAKRLHTLIDSDNERISLDASTKALDYAGYKPVDKSLSVNVSVEQAFSELI